VRYRIAMWASAGFVIAVGWAIYFAMASKDVPIAPIVETLVRVTCPIAFASFYFHFPVGIYSAFLANAATYALIGLIVETLRRQLHHARSSATNRY
jgi:hypothetical protein